MWSLVSEAEAGHLDVNSFVRYAAQIGVPGVELLDVFWQNEERDISRVKAVLQETRLAVSAYAIANDLVQPNEPEYVRQVQHIRHGVDVAEQLETPLLRVFSGSEKEGVSFEDGFHWIVKGLREG